MSLLESKEYWNKKIIEWENASYRDDTRGLNFIERLAARFRAPIKKRREILLDILKDNIKDKVFLELGCGSGDLCFEFLKRGAKKVVGIDIADEAIKSARAKAADSALRDKADFFVEDVRNNTGLPEADFVVGLGFIDYTDIDSLKRLFAVIKGRFIFSFPEKKINLVNILQYLYLKSQRCGEFYKFNRKQFDVIPGMNGKCRFFSVNGMTFISNFDFYA